MSDLKADDHPRSTEMVTRLVIMMQRAVQAKILGYALPVITDYRGWPPATIGQRTGEPW